MTIKIQCSCGVKFAFEAADGTTLAEGSIRCPNCGTDATPTANSVLASQTAPAAPQPQPQVRLGLSVPRHEPAPKPAASETAEAPSETSTPVVQERRSERLRKQAEEESGALNKALLGVGVALAVVVGAWAYYNFSLSRPSQIFQSPTARDAKTWLLSESRLLIVDSTRARLIEIPADKELWTTDLSKQAGDKPSTDGEDSFGESLNAEIDRDTLVVRRGKGITFVDLATGAIKNEVSFAAGGERVVTRTAAYSVLGYEANERTLVHQPLDGGPVSTQLWRLPKTAASAPLAKTNSNSVRLGARPATASSVDWGSATNKRPFTMVEFFAAPDHLVELKSELLEVVGVPRGQTKPATAPALNSALNAAGSMEAVMALGRELGSSGRQEIDDISRMRVTLRRHFGTSADVWTSEVAGPPTLFPMEDFDLLVAGFDIICLNRDNTIKWQAKMPGYLPPWAIRTAGYSQEVRSRVQNETYERPDGPDIWFLGLRAPEEQQRAGARESAPIFTSIGDKLLAVDRVNITLFEKETGNVKWRISSVGTMSIQWDGASSLYISAMSSDPYAESKNAFADPKNYIVKIDLETGAKKWTMSDEGVDVVVAGKYLYAAAIGQSIFAKPSEGSSKTALARLRPGDGSRQWVTRVDGAARGIEAVGRTILLQMNGSVEVYRYWDF